MPSQPEIKRKAPILTPRIWITAGGGGVALTQSDQCFVSKLFQKSAQRGLHVTCQADFPAAEP